MSHPADKFITKIDGPSSIVRGCNLCNYVVTTKKPRAGERGRGWGMREGNKLRGKMIQHIKEKHPDALA